MVFSFHVDNRPMDPSCDISFCASTAAWNASSAAASAPSSGKMDHLRAPVLLSNEGFLLKIYYQVIQVVTGDLFGMVK